MASQISRDSVTANDPGIPGLMPIIQDSPMVAVDLTSAYPHQTSDPALTSAQPRNDVQASTLASLGGIRVIISSLRTTTERAVQPPPSYDEALDPNALPPPAYESLFGHVQTARRTSDGVADFVKNLTILLFGTIGCVACIGLAIVIPVAMVVIGSLYFHDCPKEDKIPLYLIVGGSITLLNNLLGNSKVQRSEGSSQMNVGTRRSPLKAFITTFMFIWFILGSIWVYKAYDYNYDDPTSPNYCDQTLYLFAFWVITSSYLVLMIISIAICCVGFLAAGIQEQFQET